MNANPKEVVGRLDFPARRALEQTVEQAAQRGLYSVVPSQFLLCLLADERSGARRLLASLGVSPQIAMMELRNAGRDLPAGNPGRPDLDKRLFQWIREAWELASGEGGRGKVGGEHLLAMWIVDKVRFGGDRMSTAFGRPDAAVVRQAAHDVASAAGSSSGATSSAPDKRLQFLDNQIDHHDPRRGSGSPIELAEAMLVLASHPDTKTQPAITSKGMVFGMNLPRSQAGIAPRFDRTRSILREWLAGQDAEARLGFRDRAINSLLLGPSAEIAEHLCGLLGLPLPDAEPPVVYDCGPAPDPKTQAEWVRRLDAALSRLDSRIDTHGRVTDPLWRQQILEEQDGTEGEEVPVIVRGTPLSTQHLDRLAAELEAQGLFLPADYRAFLSRCGGLELRLCPADTVPEAEAGELRFHEGLISEPAVAEYPDDCPPRLMFFDSLETGYFAFEFAQTLQLVDQSGDWGGIDPGHSRTLMAYECFADWLEDYFDCAFAAFSYRQ